VEEGTRSHNARVSNHNTGPTKATQMRAIAKYTESLYMGSELVKKLSKTCPGRACLPLGSTPAGPSETKPAMGPRPKFGRIE
jgi:hypothetical protein